MATTRSQQAPGQPPRAALRRWLPQLVGVIVIGSILLCCSAVQSFSESNPGEQAYRAKVAEVIQAELD